MINGETIEQAEGRLRTAGQLSGMVGVHSHVDLDSDALAKFVKACRENIPDLDESGRAITDTFLAHAFMVGATAKDIDSQGEE